MLPDAETIESVGGLGGIGAVFGFIILAVSVWFLREHFKIQRDGEEYRRKRDDSFIATLNTLIATVTELKNSVDKFTEIDTIVERLRSKHADTENR